MDGDGISLSVGERNNSQEAVLGAVFCVASWGCMMYIGISVNATTQEDLKMSGHVHRSKVLGSAHDLKHVRYEGACFFFLSDHPSTRHKNSESERRGGSR